MSEVIVSLPCENSPGHGLNIKSHQKLSLGPADMSATELHVQTEYV